MIEFTQIKETCLYMHDLELARSFYHEKLQLPVINYLPHKHLFLRAGGNVLLIFNPDDSKTKKSPPAHFGGGKQHLALEVSSQAYENARDAITSAGIPIIDEVQWPSGKKSFYFNDPEGNVLEIVPSEGIWD
jgi:catechol 2,3-dioxygenase-like lactoylglutathione lyase family enzyme